MATKLSKFKENEEREKKDGGNQVAKIQEEREKKGIKKKFCDNQTKFRKWKKEKKKKRKNKTNQKEWYFTLQHPHFGGPLHRISKKAGKVNKIHYNNIYIYIYIFILESYNIYTHIYIPNFQYCGSCTVLLK